MESPAVSQILYHLDRAFDGSEWHSLLGNLKPVTPEDWLWVPPGGRRSIRDIVQHVGVGKFMYHHHAFDTATLHWDDPLVDRWDVVETIPSAIDWLRETHNRLRQSIAALQDADLLQQRPNFRGQLKETRWLITTTIEHDLYHAGEINHTRCLHQETTNNLETSMHHQWHRDHYTISTDPARLDLHLIYDFLSTQSYWAQDRTLDTVRTSIQHSLPFGLYHHDNQIGFCRLVTDYATFAWLADVFILPDHRGRKLGEWLIETLLSHHDLQSLPRWLLATRDAHALYTKFGFQPLENPDRFMMRRPRP